MNDSFTVANRDGSPEKLSTKTVLNKEQTKRIAAALDPHYNPSPTPSGDRSGGFAPLDRAGEDIDRADCNMTQHKPPLTREQQKARRGLVFSSGAPVIIG